MKISANLKIYIVIFSAIIVILNGCNSEIKHNITKPKAVSKNTPKRETFTIDLYNSLPLVPKTKYLWQLKSNYDTNLMANESSFTCNSKNTCSINLSLIPHKQYSLDIFQEKSHVGIGSVTFMSPLNKKAASEHITLIVSKKIY